MWVSRCVCVVWMVRIEIFVCVKLLLYECVFVKCVWEVEIDDLRWELKVLEMCLVTTFERYRVVVRVVGVVFEWDCVMLCVCMLVLDVKCDGVCDVLCEI